MPKALAIDKEEVLATYKATGSLAETSRAHGIGYNVVKQWARRYNWPTPSRILQRIDTAKEELKRHNEVIGMPVTLDAKEAIGRSVEDNKAVFVSTMATSLAKASQEIAASPSALEHSRRMVDLAGAAKTILGLGADSDAPRLSVNVLSLDASALSIVPGSSGNTLTL